MSFLIGQCPQRFYNSPMGGEALFNPTGHKLMSLPSLILNIVPSPVLRFGQSGIGVREGEGVGEESTLPHLASFPHLQM